ncbi:MAG TPA: transaldolase family protein [Myxococcota bacterium]|nr:transaldolase [Myxococcota bacterium]HNZ03915.1 transaldolase family protein [Myxococcota bacterium]HPB50992.1 transaldolase family protein [Myxococcota bacterium]HQP96014.1 transaldolase family protein [Myxococcota bacterium]
MAQKSNLKLTTEIGKTDFWNDSCSVHELTYAISHGAVGATTNPTIVLGVLRNEMDLWRDTITGLVRDNPTWTEAEIAWRLIEMMAVKGAELLKPVFDANNGTKGRISIQTNPEFWRDPVRLAEQAIHFGGLAANMQVKIPATQAGIKAIEDATAAGVNINATVSFTVPQALEVGAAVERGLKRRVAKGLPIDGMSPVCTIMVGRLDDWMKVVAKRDAIMVTPGDLDWAGIAAFKRATAIYAERGYRTRMLAAAYRHHMHWSELVGGDVVLTIPYQWQVLINASDIPVVPRFDNQVPPVALETLVRHFPDFVKAYEPDGLSCADFDTYGPTVRTLRAFLQSYHELLAVVREFMLPNPDVAKSQAATVR